MRVLESLAVIGPYTFFPFERFLLDEQYGIPTGATQIVVTPSFTPGIEAALRELHERGKRIVLVCVDRTSPNLEALPFPAYYVPPSAAMRVIDEEQRPAAEPNV